MPLALGPARPAFEAERTAESQWGGPDGVSADAPVNPPRGAPATVHKHATDSSDSLLGFAGARLPRAATKRTPWTRSSSSRRKASSLLSTDAQRWFPTQSRACSPRKVRNLSPAAGRVRRATSPDYPVFCGTSSGSFTETTQGEISFPEISTPILEKICQYFYYKLRYMNNTSNIPEFHIEPEIALELLMAANYLDA
eukprot:scaffold2058_cov403-Prasinococcus_capsulatus_cf.AAC.14